MAKNIKIIYDEVEDILYLGEKDRVKFSIDLALPSGDLVVDIGFDGLVKGIEIFNASKFFSILQKELKKVENVDFKIIYSPLYISINISLNEGKIKNSIIVPYSKKLVLAG